MAVLGCSTRVSAPSPQGAVMICAVSCRVLLCAAVLGPRGITHPAVPWTCFSGVLQTGATRWRTPGQPGHISLGQRRPNSHHPHAAELAAATLQVPPLVQPAVRCAVLMMRSSKHGAARSAATSSSGSRQMRSNSSQHHNRHSSNSSSMMLRAVLAHRSSSSRSARQRVRTSAAG